MRPLLAGLGMLAVLATPAGRDARAGMLAACDEPAGFTGPVQVFVLQYGFEPSAVDADPRLAETARRLSYLIQLDVLANDSYGSIASILLQGPSDSCRAAVVQRRLLESGTLRPGQAVALEWGRIYREGDEVLVQTYLRFLRVDPEERRFADERFPITLSGPAVRLEGALPTQSIAFAPRRLSAERLDRIDAAWREAARLYDRPDTSAGARELPPPEERVAYFVRETREDGWLGVELSQGGGHAWLKADPEVGGSLRELLRELLPELDYVEGVIGYLSYRQAADGRGFPTPPARWMLERIENRFAPFIEPPGETSALALTLLGALQAFTTPDQVPAGLEALREALRQQPNDGKLRNLVAMAELRQCCAGDGTGPVLKQVPQMLLAGLAVDPNNADLLANLETTYAWLAGQPGGTTGETGVLATGLARVNANLRAGPSSGSPKVGLARSGSRLTITGTNAAGDWLRVDRGDAPEAYVAAHLMKDLQPLAGASARLVCSAMGGRTLCRTSSIAPAPGPPSEPSPRLIEAGLSPSEVSVRLEQVKELRQALGHIE